MKISLKPVTKDYEVWYGGEKVCLTIKQATQADFIRIQDLYADASQVYDKDNRNRVELKMKFNPEEIRREQAFCTLLSCDILTDDDTPLFRSEVGANGVYLKMSPAEFKKAWGYLPPALALDIFKCVIDLNPDWDSNAGE